MFICTSMFVIFGLFLLSFCDTTLSKCNDTNSCSCIVPDNEAGKLTNLLYKRSSETKEPYKFFVDLCTTETDKISESKTKNDEDKNGLVCAIILQGTNNPVNLKVIKQSIVDTEGEYKNISVSVVSGNLTTQTYVSCCMQCDSQTAADVDHSTMYHVPLLQATDIYNKQLFSSGLSTGSTLVILLFVFSGIYFVGGAILLKLLRGATGWEILPNHKFWCELPSLIRDGITFTFNCGRESSYERI